MGYDLVKLYDCVHGPMIHAQVLDALRRLEDPAVLAERIEDLWSSDTLERAAMDAMFIDLGVRGELRRRMSESNELRAHVSNIDRRLGQALTPKHDSDNDGLHRRRELFHQRQLRWQRRDEHRDRTLEDGTPERESRPSRSGRVRAPLALLVIGAELAYEADLPAD